MAERFLLWSLGFGYASIAALVWLRCGWLVWVVIAAMVVTTFALALYIADEIAKAQQGNRRG